MLSHAGVQGATQVQRDMAALRQEIDILRGLSHEHIIKLLDFYETPQEFCLITEFAQGAHAALLCGHSPS